VANLKVSWTWTFSNGAVLKTSGFTNTNGRAYSTIPITWGMGKGFAHITAHVQSGSVNRTSTTSFRRT
jgi:hypothetical protein